MELDDNSEIEGYRYTGKIANDLARKHFKCDNPVLAFENDNPGDYLSHWEKAVFL